MTAFALRLTLAPVPASHHDVLHEIGHRLDPYQPQLVVEDADLVLTLRVEARDLWLAVLLAMAAVTDLGYPVARLDAGPAEPMSIDRPPPAADREPCPTHG